MTMKKLIKWTLNHVPRPLLQRIAGWAVPMAGLFYRGRGAECPVCGAKHSPLINCPNCALNRRPAQSETPRGSGKKPPWEK